MSRSYKKFPFCSDGDGGNAKTGKKFANRKVRRAELESLPRKGNYYKKIYEQWEIRDWSSRWTWAEARKSYENSPHWQKKFSTLKEFYIYWFKTMMAK